MDTAYKIYANILNERLKREAERKLGEGQFGFRKGRGTINTIFTLNCIVNKEITKKEGKILAFFADLKAVFDRVDRKRLAEMLNKEGINKKLKRRILETYTQTVHNIQWTSVFSSY